MKRCVVVAAVPYVVAIPFNVRVALALGALVVMAVALTGCQPALQQGETYHKLTVAWPIFDIEKSEGVGQDGVRWTKEKGDAAFWLASWERTTKFDKCNNEIYDKERSTGIPFFNKEREESQQFIKTWGSVLFCPYQSYTDKSPAGAAPRSPAGAVPPAPPRSAVTPG
jgi:hypothetical protein